MNSTRIHSSLVPAWRWMKILSTFHLQENCISYILQPMLRTPYWIKLAERRNLLVRGTLQWARVALYSCKLCSTLKWARVALYSCKLCSTLHTTYNRCASVRPFKRRLQLTCGRVTCTCGRRVPVGQRETGSGPSGTPHTTPLGCNRSRGEKETHFVETGTHTHNTHIAPENPHKMLLKYTAAV